MRGALSLRGKLHLLCLREERGPVGGEDEPIGDGLVETGGVGGEIAALGVVQPDELGLR